MDRVSRSGCIACRIDTGAYRDAEIHHITSAGRRMGHKFSLPLCSWHHRSAPDGTMTPPLMREVYGPSLAESKKEFVARYGTELDLLMKVRTWLGVTDELDQVSD